MSLYPLSIFGSSYFGWGGLAAPVKDNPVAPEEKAKEENALERDRYFAAGPGLSDFCADAPPPTLETWWRMRQNPQIVFAYGLCVLPVIAGTRNATIRNADGTAAAPKGPTVPTGKGAQVTNTPEEKRRKLTEDVYETLWPDVLTGLEYLNFGEWTVEQQWARRLDVVAPSRFKSFTPGTLQHLRDKYNDWAGYKLGQEERDARYGVHFVCNGHLHDPLFGWPRTRNAREAWWRSVKSHQNGDRLERKASGTQIFMETAPASFMDANGKPVVPLTALTTMMNAAAQNQGFSAPSTPFKMQTIEGKPELASIPAVKVTPIDWGETGSALAACIARLGRLDIEIVRAYHRPEREGMQGTSGTGTKAEAGVHGQVGIIDSEGIASDFCRQLNCQSVNRFLVTNFGADAADSIYFKPAPLADPQQEFLQTLVQALFANPAEGPAMLAHLDKRATMKRVEIPMVREEDVVEPPPMDMTNPNAGPSVNGAGGRMGDLAGANGNGNGN